MSDTVTSTQFHRVFAAFDARDVATLVEFITDDIKVRLGNAETVHGKAAFVGAVNAFHGSVAGVRHEILHVYRDGDVAILEFDVHYTRLDGKAVTLPCCNVFRLRNGLIAEYRSYVDATPVYADTSEA
jgi:ketosteroid isomerase-like protein